MRPGPLAGPMRAGIRPAENDGGELDVDADGEPIPPEVDPDDGDGDGDGDGDATDEPDDDTLDEPIGPQPAEQPAGVDRAQVRAFSAALRDCRRSQMLATIAPFARRLEAELGAGDAGPIVAQIVDDDGTIRTPDGLPKGARVAQLYGVAPAIRVSLTPEEILEIDQWGEVDTIYPVTAAQNELGITRVAVGANHLHDWGIDGAGQRIGVTEVGGEVTFDFDDNPAVDMGLITTDTLDACQNQHGDTVVGVLHSQDSLQRGIASAAEIRVGGSCNGDDVELVAASDRAVAWGATVLNLSWGMPVAVGSAPGFVDRTYDQMVYDDAVTVVKSAGNRGTTDGMVTSPGLGYGVLTVGNHDDSNSARWGDDVIAATSSFRDPGSLHSDRNKPEIAAPGESVDSTQHAIFFATSGTSLAAPHVSGAAALLQQRDAMFELFPEGMKAVLMASAVHNIEGATRISDRDGAGGLVVDNADNIFRGVTGDWDGRLETCDEGNAHVVTTMPLRAGLLTRAVLVWGTEGAYGRYELEPSADLDLDVWGPGGVRVAASGTWENSYEIVEFTPSVSGPHDLRVFDFRCDGNNTRRVAWAWVQEYPRSIEYAVELKDQGWGVWASNGGSAGNPSGTRRIERFRSRGIGMPAVTGVEYQVRQTNVGWSPVRRNGEGAGVDVRKLQSLKMWLTNQPTGWGVRYRLDRPVTGWTAWHEDGEEAGWNVLSAVKNAVQVTVVPAHEN
ncbi:MAG: S8 family serine peptidase [Myxococcales bacterium]|nr:S8 family serine peptidase [Myxococcales bacterium]